MIKEQDIQIKDLEIILWEFIGHRLEELSVLILQRICKYHA